MTEKIRASKEEIMNSAEFLTGFSQNKNYQDNLQTLINYIADITNVMLEYKEMTEKLTKILDQLGKMAKNVPQDHKKKVR